MRRYYIISGALLLLLLALLLLPLPGNLFWIMAPSAVAIWLAAVIYGVSRICSGMFLRAECFAEGCRHKVALTFDDGPNGPATDRILAILERHGAKATFFVIGRKVEENSEVLCRVKAAGHDLGNHSWSHSYIFPMFRGRRIAAEIRRTNEALEKFSGETPRWFRPPFGVTNPNLYRGLQHSPMRVAGWSIRSFDTRNEPAERVLRRIDRKLKGGEVVLLHEHSRNIGEILESLLSLMAEKGLEAVSLDCLFD